MAHRVPPILRMTAHDPMPSCSKAPRGLFVLSRVTCIFTGTSISPSPLLRQCPSRYAFRAGRNLPDKEFRYLRTVIVTAAVYRGFSSKLAPLPLTFRHWAGVSPYTSAMRVEQRPVFLVNSRLGLVRATPESSVGKPPHLPGYPFSRSYGANLPSSLTRVLSIALVSSTYLPVSVCGTGTSTSTLRGFSGSYGIDDSSLLNGGLGPVLTASRGFPSGIPGYDGTRTLSSWPALIYPATSPHRSLLVVTEYKPFVHRLRTLASA
jgi:hypothetical protein